VESLSQMLDLISSCSACHLMRENRSIGIRYVPILPKPQARVVFVGRDPSPRTAEIVGIRGGRSAFINEIFTIVDKAGVSDSDIYITDLCKCHWRTSSGKPLAQTERRSARLDPDIAGTCMETWLIRELQLLVPKLVVIFGEEVYQLIRPLVERPSPAPKKLSARANKSIGDAEGWFVKNGPLAIIDSTGSFPLAPLRHPGNSRRLPKSPAHGDLRLEFHRKATELVVTLVKTACA